MNFILRISLLDIIHFLLGAIIFAVPVFFVPTLLSPFVEAKTFLFLALVEVSFFFYVILALSDHSYRPVKNNVFYFFLLLTIFQILSAFLSPNPINSFWSEPVRFDGVIVLTHVFLFFLVFSSVVRSRKVLNRFIMTSVLSAFVVVLSVYSSSLNYFQHNYFGLKVAKGLDLGGILSNDSYAGVYLLFNVFLIVYLIFNTQSNIKRYILEVLLPIFLLSPIFFNFDIFKLKFSLTQIIQSPLVLLGSARAATISLYAGLTVAILLFLLSSKNKLLKFFSKTVLLGLLGFIILFLVSVVTPGTQTNDWFISKTGNQRFVFWEQAILGIKERPVLGWGTGNFHLVNEKYFNPNFVGTDYYAADSSADKAHNIVLDTAVTGGLVGVLLYLCVIISALILLWRSSQAERLDKAIFSGVLFAYFIQNLVFFDVLVSHIMYVVVLCSIIIVSYKRKVVLLHNQRVSFFSQRVRYLILPLFIVTLISLQYFVLNPVKESYLNFNYFNLAPDVRGFYSGETDFSFYGGSQMAEVYSVSVFNWYLANFNRISKQPSILPYVLDINGVIRTIIQNSSNKNTNFWATNSIFQLSDMKYQLTKNEALFPSMLFYAEREISLSPKNIRGYVNKGRVLFYQKQYNEAIATLEAALMLNPWNVQVHNLIIDVARVSGNQDLLKEKVERANKLFSQKN